MFSQTHLKNKILIYAFQMLLNRTKEQTTKSLRIKCVLTGLFVKRSGKVCLEMHDIKLHIRSQFASETETRVAVLVVYVFDISPPPLSRTA